MSAIPLDPTRRSPEAETFAAALRQRIAGHDAAVERLAETYQVFLAVLGAPRRPLANLLFLSPTGLGKTRLVEAMAEALFGGAGAVVVADHDPSNGHLSFAKRRCEALVHVAAA